MAYPNWPWPLDHNETMKKEKCMIRFTHHKVARETRPTQHFTKEGRGGLPHERPEVGNDATHGANVAPSIHSLKEKRL
jgi:hypothetical protein